MPPVIEVDRLTKRYKRADSNAVDGVSFSVQAGEFFALLGPNGAGKTTTVSILTTTLLPTTGSARIAGYDIVRDAGAVRRRVSIIFQKPSLDLNLTAEENIRFHAILYGLFPFRPTFDSMPQAYRREVQRLAELLGLERDVFRPVKTFSGGMQRKLEILRGLVHRPEVLFLDEPTAGLDAATRRGLWTHLKEVRARGGTTVFLTTHYLEEAEGADKVCIIDHGRIVSLGTPDRVRAELAEEYLVVDAEDRAGLLSELRQLDMPFSEAPEVRIALDGRSAHQVLRLITTPLTVVKTHSPTLEDAYLAILRDHE